MNEKELKRQIQVEIDSAFLYNVLSENETNPDLAVIFRKMSNIEKGHAYKLLDKYNNLVKGNEPMPPISFGARLKNKIAKYIGYGFILSDLISVEIKISSSIANVKRDRGDIVTSSDFNHVKILESLADSKGVAGNIFTKFEGRHKSVGGNALRAAVLGANDGLVSNLSLIMGVAGAISDDQSIIITGLAGLLAGAISMAMGEWLSVKNSTELYENQIALELEELENNPEEELLELTLIYQAKGMSKEEAEIAANKIFENKDTALETLVQEELGINIHEEQDSAWEAAITSFILFAFGAIIPLFPFFIANGNKAVIYSLLVSTVGLFGIGAATTLFTGKTVAFAGFRQVLFGLVAAGITYGIGSMVGARLV